MGVDGQADVGGVGAHLDGQGGLGDQLAGVGADHAGADEALVRLVEQQLGHALAAAKGHHAAVTALIKHPDIDIDARADYYGRTALIEAARTGHLGIVKLLVEHGADVNAADKTGRNNALIEAIKGRHYDVVQYLLETRKVNFLNKDMRLNALIWAGSTRNAELIETLEAAIHAFFDGK